MTDIPYHEAKSFLEREIQQYHNGKSDPEFKVSKNKSTFGSDTSIYYKVDSQVDLLPIIISTLKPLGEAKVRDTYNSLSFEVGKLKINFDQCGTIYVHKSMSFSKEGDLTSEELQAVLDAYKKCHPSEQDNPLEQLEKCGSIVYHPNKTFTWDYLAGYEAVKQEVKDSLILPFSHPEVYDRMAKGTRKVYESNRPRAVLFEGPPGTGKTTMARIIAGEVKVPLVYLPLESIMTKWYGESERNLSKVFQYCKEMGSTIIFLDEIDALATSRDNPTSHEATRRVLSVLLREIDGFLPNDKTLLVGATNRKQDLDAALISRFDLSILFPLPNINERSAIFANYAQHLFPVDFGVLAKGSECLSGRNIKDVCEHAERKWASKVVSGTATEELPSIDEYIHAVKSRKTNGI
jgi:SpoVK/Ycf46/Vps4 family AAA+-type ATPase